MEVLGDRCFDLLNNRQEPHFEEVSGQMQLQGLELTLLVLLVVVRVLDTCVIPVLTV